MEREQIINILNEEQYPDFMIDSTIIKIERLSPIIAEAFEKWVKNNLHPDLSVEGYSYEELVNEWGMKPVGAFITLDWLIREPEKAKKCLMKRIK